jgi:hypothetical protein
MVIYNGCAAVITEEHVPRTSVSQLYSATNLNTQIPAKSLFPHSVIRNSILWGGKPAL